MTGSTEKVEAHREALPLAYEMREVKPPVDFGCAFRQITFAAGAGFVAGGLVDWLGGYEAWRDNAVLWIGFGTGMIALVIPFPCGFRRGRPMSR